MGRTLEAIVRDLGVEDPWIEGDVFQGVGCRYCDEPKHDGMEHPLGCEWRRAVEWVAEHPASEGGE